MGANVHPWLCDLSYLQFCLYMCLCKILEISLRIFISEVRKIISVAFKYRSIWACSSGRQEKGRESDGKN